MLVLHFKGKIQVGVVPHDLTVTVDSLTEPLLVINGMDGVASFQASSSIFPSMTISVPILVEVRVGVGLEAFALI